MSTYKTKRIIIHCSESNWGDVDVIRGWHTKEPPKGNGWRDIGYNGVILNGFSGYKDLYNKNVDGMFQEGRALDFDTYIDSEEKAAHTLGYNKDSIGVCLIGKKEFTINQFLTLFYFCKMFLAISPDIEIKGHYQMSTARGKTCPNFDVDAFIKLIKGNYQDALIENITHLLPVVYKGE